VPLWEGRENRFERIDGDYPLMLITAHGGTILATYDGTTPAVGNGHILDEGTFYLVDRSTAKNMVFKVVADGKVRASSGSFVLATEDGRWLGTDDGRVLGSDPSPVGYVYGSPMVY
jgi:hypothetical protein